jgi:hypothetical protein
MKCFRLDLQNRHFSHKNFVSFFHISLDTTGYNISRKRFQLSTNVTVARSDYIFVSANFEFTGFFLFYSRLFFSTTFSCFTSRCRFLMSRASLSFFLLFHFGAVFSLVSFGKSNLPIGAAAILFYFPSFCFVLLFLSCCRSMSQFISFNSIDPSANEIIGKNRICHLFFFYYKECRHVLYVYRQLSRCIQQRQESSGTVT